MIFSWSISLFKLFELTKLISAALADPVSVSVTDSFPKAETVPATLAWYNALTSDKAPVIAVAPTVTTPAVLALIAFKSAASIVRSETVTAYSFEEEVNIYLESLPDVISCIKNMEYIKIPYQDHNNLSRLYVPDFFVKTQDGNICIIETKGGEYIDDPIKKNALEINFREKFTFRRGRVNCSVKDGDIWRWLGIQMSVEIN